MSTSLSDLRKQKDAPSSLPTRIVTACLDQSLLSDIQRLTAERADLQTQDALSRSASDDGDGRPRKMGERANPRIAEIDAELVPLHQRLRDAEGEILLRATDGGSWLRWKDQHPARKDNDLDERLAYGFCNAADLADDLGNYAVSWNGDEFAPGDWDWFVKKIAPADIGACVSAVIELMESRIVAPKLPSTSSEPPMSEPDSPSPAA